jgi:hypothetical protein
MVCFDLQLLFPANRALKYFLYLYRKGRDIYNTWSIISLAWLLTSPSTLVFITKKTHKCRISDFRLDVNVICPFWDFMQCKMLLLTDEVGQPISPFSKAELSKKNATNRFSRKCIQYKVSSIWSDFNPSNAQLNPIWHLLSLLRTHHILHVSRLRVKQSQNMSTTFGKEF